MSLTNFAIKEIILTTKEGKTINLNSGVLSKFVIREDIFSPYMTAEIELTDTDGIFYNRKTNKDDNGSYINGGEKVSIIIETEVSGKINTKETKNHFYVDKTTPIVTKSNKQSGVLRLVTKEAIVNECSRLVRRYDGTIEETVKKIVKSDLEGLASEKEYNKFLQSNDYKTLNKYSFIANIEKPFEVIKKLSRKAVPSIKKNQKFKTAGYYYFENFDGIYFVGIDTLLEGKLNKGLETKYKEIDINAKELGIPYYRYSEVVSKNIPEELRIIGYPVIESKNDVLMSLLGGMYGINVTEFDAFTFNRNDFNLMLDEIYKNGMEHSIKNAESAPNFNLNDEMKKMNKNYSRRVYRIKSNHAFGKGNSLNDTFVDEKDTSKYQAESIIRNHLLFSQRMSIQVPLNLNLKVGQLIYCELPRAISGTEKEIDNDRMSGKYLITALCHDLSYYYESEKTGRIPVTKLELVKDYYKDSKVK